MELAKKIAEYFSFAHRVRAEFGVPIRRQISDTVRLSVMPGKIGPGDYYSYRLFDPALTFAEKKKFVGWKAEARLDALNEPAWHCLGLDKVLMYSLFQNAGIRIPQTRAIYLPGPGRLLAGTTMLGTQDQLREWLRSQENYPFFSKPSASGFARGACFAERYDPSQDRVIFKEGTSLAVNDFEEQCMDVERLGYVFQHPVQPDSRLVDKLGKTLSSLRMIVLYDEFQPPVLHRCFWKLPTGNNTHDNYNGGVTGNLAAAINHKTGQITRVINGTGLDVIEVTHHPDTGVRLDSLSVPDWDRVLDFTLRAALTLPKLRFQQWDIALSEDGPVVLEVNLFGTGGCDLTQLLYRKGLLDETMESFLHRHHL